MKANVRKQAQDLLEKLPQSEVTKRLRWEFERKGFLSKREMKELEWERSKLTSTGGLDLQRVESHGS